LIGTALTGVGSINEKQSEKFKNLIFSPELLSKPVLF
jgi:hypothetical protein